MFIVIIFLSSALSEFCTLQIRILIFQNSKYLAITVNIYFIKVAKLMFFLSALYMLWNVLIVKVDKLYTVNLYVSLSALYTLQHVPIVTYSCKLLYSKKKKKKKKKKTRTSVWVKIPKLCHNTPLSIFSLGKGRKSLRLKTLHKN